MQMPRLRIAEDSEMARRHAGEAERHLATGDDVIRRQRASIKKREAQGRDTADAVALLTTYLNSRSLLVRVRDRLRAVLED